MQWCVTCLHASGVLEEHPHEELLTEVMSPGVEGKEAECGL